MKGWLAFFFCFLAFPVAAAGVHGLAMHGEPKYPADFTHFDYVYPDAPKGGALRQASFGTFDTFNPFSIKGAAAPGTGLLFDTLMTESLDEPFSEYGLLAQSIELAPDRSWVAFELNPAARFADGSPVTSADVLFSFQTLREKGVPQYRYYFGDVADVYQDGPRRVVFVFREGSNRELPLILGQMPVFSRQDWQGKDFTATTLTPPLGSGPYRVKAFEPGRFVVYERRPDYWGASLPVNKGQYNFDTIRYDVYRDTTVALEAFKAGAYDIRVENEAKKWATAYDFDAVKKGRVILREWHHGLPSGMQGFVMNTRRPLFADRRVREALGLAFDFDWSNKNLFYGMYQRTTSYFDNSTLAAKGLPEGAEKALLEKLGAPKEVLTRPITFPSVQNGQIRPQLMQALALLEQAGWTVQNGRLVNAAGEPFAFEILLDSAGGPAWERIVLPYVRHLKKLGMDVRVRVMDVLQYKNRLDTFDFDMFVMVWGQSLSPGNEQRYFWGSAAAKQPGSYNFAGIQDPLIDALIEEVIAADTRTELETAVRALDRVLLHGYYVVPHWFSPVSRFAYWDKFGMPDSEPMKGISLMTWWAR